jgi:hypothetical protein
LYEPVAIQASNAGCIESPADKLVAPMLAQRIVDDGCPFARSVGHVERVSP